MPFARPPEVTVLADQIDTISDATDLLVDQQDVTPLGLAYQAIELQTTEDALDAALRRVLPGDEGLTVATGIVYLDVDDEITSAAARIRDAESRRIRDHCCRTARASRRRGSTSGCSPATR